MLKVELKKAYADILGVEPSKSLSKKEIEGECITALRSKYKVDNYNDFEVIGCASKLLSSVFPTSYSREKLLSCIRIIKWLDLTKVKFDIRSHGSWSYGLEVHFEDEPYSIYYTKDNCYLLEAR